MDGFPVVSQVKSFVQWLSGDNEGALQTQETFTKRCPGVSQVRSVMEYMSGDTEAAINTQNEFVGVVNQCVNSIPVVGHVKSGIHYIAGDKEECEMAFKAASRTVGVTVGGVVGFAAGGPVGAYAGGSAAGFTMDGIITACDININGPIADEYGLFKRFKEFSESDHKAGDFVDIIGTTVVGGLTGMAAGKTACSKTKQKLSNNKEISERNIQAETQGTQVISINNSEIQNMQILNYVNPN